MGDFSEDLVHARDDFLVIKNKVNANTKNHPQVRDLYHVYWNTYKQAFADDQSKSALADLNDYYGRSRDILIFQSIIEYFIKNFTHILSQEESKS